MILSGGAILSPSVKTDLADRMPGSMIIDGYGSSEAGGQGQSVTVKGAEPTEAPRFRVNDETTVAHPGLRARAGRRRRQARTPRPHPARLLQGSREVRGHVPGRRTASAGRCPATTPAIEEDGTITLLGRGSVSINTGGEKVYPEEVESALKYDADVMDAIVVGVPDPRWGERVVALIEPRAGHAIDPIEIDRHVRDHVAGLQGAARHPRRRRDRPLAFGQAGLPVGQSDRDQPARRGRARPRARRDRPRDHRALPSSRWRIDIVWCSVATVDDDDRPRSRILHPIWEWDGTSAAGLDRHQPDADQASRTSSAVRSCRAATGRRTTTPASPSAGPSGRSTTTPAPRSGTGSSTRPTPVGYDPAIVPPWSGGPTSDAFAVLAARPLEAPRHARNDDARAAPVTSSPGTPDPNEPAGSESSPYLRQHADNPVDWYPWGDEAFARAKAEDKPILLSVGYSACHWCHVMAHESFENPEIAARDERAVRQREGRPRGAARRRLDLHGRGAGAHRARRLADDGLPHPGGPTRSSAAPTSQRTTARACPASSASWTRSTTSGARSATTVTDQADQLTNAMSAGTLRDQLRPETSDEQRSPPPCSTRAEDALGTQLRRDARRLRVRAEVPPVDGDRLPAAPVRPQRATRDADHDHDDPRRDGRGRHLRPRRRRVRPLLHRCALARPALREDALRRGAPRRRVPARLPGHRRRRGTGASSRRRSRTCCATCGMPTAASTPPRTQTVKGSRASSTSGAWTS